MSDEWNAENTFKGQVEKEEPWKETTVREGRRERKEAQGKSWMKPDHDAVRGRLGQGPSLKPTECQTHRAQAPSHLHWHIVSLGMLIEATG